MKSSGIYLSGVANVDDPPSKLFELGYHMVLGGVDVALLRDAVNSNVKKIKGTLVDNIIQGY